MHFFKELFAIQFTQTDLIFHIECQNDDDDCDVVVSRDRRVPNDAVECHEEKDGGHCAQDAH